MSAERFKCPDCGIGVRADEDGCCVHCGADCEIVPVKVAQPKHEHEWEDDGKRFRVYFPDDNAGWWVQVEEGESDLAEEVVVTALSNEIAKLKGLVPPGGEE